MTLRKVSDMSKLQNWAVKDILKLRFAGITSDCGFGKTIVALSVAKLMVNRGFKVVIVGNKEGVLGAWSNEYKKWEHTADLKVQILTGTPNEREHKLKQDAHIYVVSYPLLKWLAGVNPHKFGMAIADEASCLKAGKSVWRDNLEKLSDGCAVRLELTATPKTNQEDDYFGLAHWLDGGKALGANITTFREQYMKGKPISNNHIIWKMRNQKCCEQVRQKVKHLFIEYPLAGSSEIPIETKRMYGSLRPESKFLFEEFRDTGVLAGHDIRDGKPLGALEIINLTSQLSSGFIYNDMDERISVAELMAAPSALALLKRKKKVAIKLFDDRIVLLKKLIDRIHQKHGQARNILICYYFKHELEQLMSVLPGATPDTSSDFENRWNEGKIKYGLLQYNRSSKARNLQGGGNIMVFYSMTFGWEDTYQIPRRLARQGQKADKVYLYILHIRGTTDDLKTEKDSKKTVGHKAMQKLILKQIKAG